MNVVIASDHAGFPLKQWLVEVLAKDGIPLMDLGVHSTEPVDYPDVALLVCNAITGGTAERGILLCGSGLGASIAANKVKGIRAGVAHDTYSGHQGVEHDDMNVLCMGARVIGSEPAREIARAFLGAKFSNEERHLRRVIKVKAIESQG
jgi:ribose 5-phosphate isomerase B